MADDLKSQVKELRRALTEKGQQVSELQNTVNTLLRRSHNMAGAPPQNWGDLYNGGSSEAESYQPGASAPVKTYTEDEVQAMIDQRIQAAKAADFSQEQQARNLVAKFAQEHPDLIPYRGAVITAYMAASGTMEEKVTAAVAQVRGMIASGMLPPAAPPPQHTGGVMHNGQIPGMGAGQANAYIRRNEQGQAVEQIVYNDEFLAKELKEWGNTRRAQLDARKEAGYR